MKNQLYIMKKKQRKNPQSFFFSLLFFYNIKVDSTYFKAAEDLDQFVQSIKLFEMYVID